LARSASALVSSNQTIKQSKQSNNSLCGLQAQLADRARAAIKQSNNPNNQSIPFVVSKPSLLIEREQQSNNQTIQTIKQFPLWAPSSALRI